MSLEGEQEQERTGELLGPADATQSRGPAEAHTPWPSSIVVGPGVAASCQTLVPVERTSRRSWPTLTPRNALQRHVRLVDYRTRRQEKTPANYARDLAQLVTCSTT